MHTDIAQTSDGMKPNPKRVREERGKRRKEKGRLKLLRNDEAVVAPYSQILVC